MSRHASGFMAWLLQRVTAVYLGLFTVYAFVQLAWFTPADFSQWQAWVVSTPVMLSLLVMVLFTLLHAWIGIRDVLIDYIWHTGLRLLLMSLVALSLLASGFWALMILVTARLA